MAVGRHSKQAPMQVYSLQYVVSSVLKWCIHGRTGQGLWSNWGTDGQNGQQGGDMPPAHGDKPPATPWSLCVPGTEWQEQCGRHKAALLVSMVVGMAKKRWRRRRLCQLRRLRHMVIPGSV